MCSQLTLKAGPAIWLPTERILVESSVFAKAHADAADYRQFMNWDLADQLCHCQSMVTVIASDTVVTKDEPRQFLCPADGS